MVLLPMDRISDDILADTIQAMFISYNMFVIVSLP